ncbi:MAG: DUF2232 domain-containing protein [Thermodesulfobacteriota bacterium]
MRVTDALGCFGAASVFLFGSVLVPFLGPFLGLLAPLPFLYYASKLGLHEGLKVSCVSLVFLGLLSFLTGYWQILFLSIEFCFLGLIVSEMYRRGLTIGYTVLLGTASVLLLGFVALALMGWSRDMGPLEMVRAYILENVREAAEVYRRVGGEDAAGGDFQQYIKVVGDMILKIYPGLLIIGTGFVVWLNVLISRPLFRVTGITFPLFGPLERWQAPERLVWGVIAAGFSLFLPVGGVQFLAVNALIVLLAVYVFQGLSILIFFLIKYRIPLWVRVGIYSLILFQQILLLGLALVGLFDQWIDFRRLNAGKAAPIG